MNAGRARTNRSAASDAHEPVGDEGPLHADGARRARRRRGCRAAPCRGTRACRSPATRPRSLSSTIVCRIVFADAAARMTPPPTDDEQRHRDRQQVDPGERRERERRKRAPRARSRARVRCTVLRPASQSVLASAPAPADASRMPSVRGPPAKCSLAYIGISALYGPIVNDSTATSASSARAGTEPGDEARAFAEAPPQPAFALAPAVPSASRIARSATQHREERRAR